jgi:hypothetical protein
MWIHEYMMGPCLIKVMLFNNIILFIDVRNDDMEDNMQFTTS